MSLQQITQLQAAEMLHKKFSQFSVDEYYYSIDYYAWPQVFGSTAGPFGGIGGATMTSFTIESWSMHNFAVLFCGNKVMKVTDKFEPLMRA